MHCTKMKFSVKDIFSNVFPADLFTFTKHFFICVVLFSCWNKTILMPSKCMIHKYLQLPCIGKTGLPKNFTAYIIIKNISTWVDNALLRYKSTIIVTTKVCMKLEKKFGCLNLDLLYYLSDLSSLVPRLVLLSLLM